MLMVKYSPVLVMVLVSVVKKLRRRRRKNKLLWVLDLSLFMYEMYARTHT